MSFTGSIEDLGVADLIQLIHVSRKSGTLRLRGRRREATITFSQGAIVSATHPLASVNVGLILVEQGLVTREHLLAALHEQDEGDHERRPLVRTLIGMGHLTESDGRRALERLVGDALGEVLTWKRGTFDFEPDSVTCFDDFAYVPEDEAFSIRLDTQQLLLEALRVMDEESTRRRNSSRLPPPRPRAERPRGARPPAPSPAADPPRFANLSSTEEHRVLARIGQAIASTLESPDESERKVALLTTDEHLREIVTRVCREGIIDLQVSASGSRLVDQVEHWIRQGVLPVAIVDGAAREGGGHRSALKEIAARLRRDAPEVPLIAISGPEIVDAATAYEHGATAYLPRPSPRGDRELQEIDRQCFDRGLSACLANLVGVHARLSRQVVEEKSVLWRLHERALEIGSRNNRQDVTLVLLKYAAEYLDRCIVFLLRQQDMLALGGFGVAPDGDDEGSSIPLLRLPIELHPALDSLFNDRGIYCGDHHRLDLCAALYRKIPPPVSPEILLVPLSIEGRMVALVYGDFGAKRPSPIRVEAWKILATQASIALELEMVRRRSNAKRGAP